MEHYVTLFDSLFLPQGLALHMSMERHVKGYTLWILCVDDEAHTVLTKLQLPNVRLLQLSKLETQELLCVKPNRSKGEYCWTLTPFAPRFVFEADPVVERVTYLDADLWFRKHPKPIFDEFNASGKQVLITDHAYAPEYDQSATSGQYCVQFMTFTRHGGEQVRKWWEERCIEWCYARFEDGKFGDQKYLDDWPSIFADYVHVLETKEVLLAPWNANRFPYSGAIIWHFQELRILNSNFVMLYKGYEIPVATKKEVYEKYLRDILLATRIMNDSGVSIKAQSTQRIASGFVTGMLKGFFRKLRQSTTFSVRKI
jgi:hypothetical protein